MAMAIVPPVSQAATSKALGAPDYPAVSRKRNRLREVVQGNKRLVLALSDIEEGLHLRQRFDPEFPLVNSSPFSLRSLHHRNDQSYQCD